MWETWVNDSLQIVFKLHNYQLGIEGFYNLPSLK
jgi:hypothetical protein